jgi:uncharacterized glyoxalase superfamily protein PhnB
MPQTVTPYLLYEECAAMLDWLERAFGFREVLRYEDETGNVTHAEMAVGDGTIYLGDPGGDYRSPQNGGGWPAQVAVYVEDVEAHHARAAAVGARIRSAPEDTPYGDRRYDAYDEEGHLWSFAQRVRDLSPEEWGAKVAG